VWAPCPPCDRSSTLSYSASPESLVSTSVYVSFHFHTNSSTTSWLWAGGVVALDATVAVSCACFYMLTTLRALS